MVSEHRLPPATRSAGSCSCSLPLAEAGTLVGGPDRVRTDDLLDANQALSQLSYGPLRTRLHMTQRRSGIEASLKVG